MDIIYLTVSIKTHPNVDSDRAKKLVKEILDETLPSSVKANVPSAIDVWLT